MSDKYQRIRDALAMGPTPGPWSIRYDYVVQAKSFDEGRLVPIAQPYGLRGDSSDLFANAAHIAACDPDTIRALLDNYEALQAECERLRTCLAETTGVAVTMLYESHKADTIKEFTVEQLSQMVETTKHLADANIQVEKVYRKAWDMAQGCAGDGMVE